MDYIHYKGNNPLYLYHQQTEARTTCDVRSSSNKWYGFCTKQAIVKLINTSSQTDAKEQPKSCSSCFARVFEIAEGYTLPEWRGSKRAAHFSSSTTKSSRITGLLR